MGVEVVSGGAVEAVAAPAKEVSAKVEAVAPGAAAVAKNMSFREESNRLGDLKDGERKALAELRAKVEEAIVGGKLFEEESGSKVVKVKVEAKKKEGKKKSKAGKAKKEAAAEEKKEEVEEAKKEVTAEEKKEETEAKKEVTAEEKKEETEAKKEVTAEEKKEETEAKKEVTAEEKKEETEAKKEVTAEEKKEETEAKKEVTAEEKKEETEAKKEVTAEEKKEETEAKKEVTAEEKKEEGATEEKKAEGTKEEVATEEKKAEVAAEEKKEETEAEKKKEETEDEEKKEETAGEAEKAAPAVVVDKDVSLWGVPLLPSKGDEATDVVLLKFLRARDFKAGAAFEMLRKTLRWRREWKSLAATASDDDTMPEGACRLDGADREGHPVCYNALGVFADDAVYRAALGDDEGKARFLRWRVRAMDSHVAELDFAPGGVASLLQVTDLKNSPGPAKKDFRVAIRQVVDLFQDNYPELVARNILINVPFSYYAFSTLFYPFLTQRTKSKFVVARPAKVTETLLKYIPIESIPVKYGGLKREGDTEFSAEDAEISEVVVKASSTETIEIEASEGDTTLTWDLTVLGWEVSYKEEFVPSDEGSYTIVVSKGRKMGAGEEAVRNSFRAGEPGKVVITVENASRGKKKVLFRHKAKSSSAKKC